MAQDSPDPTTQAFLDFLDQDMLLHPEQLVPLTEDRLLRMQELVKDVVVDDRDELPDSITL